MIGELLKVRYTESISAYVHDEFYDTVIVYIPELNAEINHSTIHSTCDKYLREPINGVRPEKVGEIEIDEADAKLIETIIKQEGIKKTLIDKYIKVEEE